MSSRRLHLLPAISALALLTACNSAPHRPAIERIAILRFENLGADPSNDWMGRAFSEIIAAELADSPGVYALSGVRLHVPGALGGHPAVAPGISAERAQALAAGATEFVYGQYTVRGATVAAGLTLEDASTGKMTVLHPVSAPAGDMLSAATALARQISSRAGAYGTRNQHVIEAEVNALETPDRPGVNENLEKAIAADPNFGPPYRQLARAKVQQKDVAGALELMKQAMAHSDSMPVRERALVQLESANLRNDSTARIEALSALTKADPNDPDDWHDLAAVCVVTHRYPQAVEAYRKAVALDPGNADYWNQLGYAAAYAGDAKAAADAIQRYQTLQPKSPNPLDSMGDVNLIAGNLIAAENGYRESSRKSPDFLASLDFLKAAMAHLTTGDVAGADSLAQPYFEARATAKDPLLDFRKAQWAWISGRRKAACQQMEQVAQAQPGSGPNELASRADSELAMWSLMLGNRDRAAELARKATARATQGSAVPAVLARFFSQPQAPAAEWQERARKLVRDAAQSAVSNLALADALLFAKEYEAARPVLQGMYDNGNPLADEGLPILLAWADLETGHVAEAAALVRANQPLADTGLTWSTPLHFPRVFYLRARIAEKQGDIGAAHENWRIFRTLSGPDPLQWDEERNAK